MAFGFGDEAFGADAVELSSIHCFTSLTFILQELIVFVPTNLSGIFIVYPFHEEVEGTR